MQRMCRQKICRQLSCLMSSEFYRGQRRGRWRESKEGPSPFLFFFPSMPPSFRLSSPPPRCLWLITPFFQMQSSGSKWDDFSAAALGKKRGERRERKPQREKRSQKKTREAEWKKEVTFFPRLAGTFEVGQDGEAREGVFLWGDRGKKKAREDRVNEMASKDELNGGRKETRSGLVLLIDSSQTHSFQHHGGVPKPEFLSSAL